MNYYLWRNSNYSDLYPCFFAFIFKSSPQLFVSLRLNPDPSSRPTALGNSTTLFGAFSGRRTETSDLEVDRYLKYARDLSHRTNQAQTMTNTDQSKQHRDLHTEFS